MTELLKCPFCGGEAKLFKGVLGFWHVMCKDRDGCGVVPITNGADTETEAIAAWNTRATHGTLTDKQVREAIEVNSWAETSTIREFNDSSWQAIADELNAVLEGRKVSE